MEPGYPVTIPDAGYFEKQVLCRTACPVKTDAGAYVQAIAEGKEEEAYLIARRTNPLASVCGRVCAAPCEAACRRSALDEAVTIRALKRFVCEQYGAETGRLDGARLRAMQAQAGRHDASGKVAVVGGGPAGLACAHDLALMGFQVTVFEAQKTAGGMLILGIPEYRLPHAIIRAEIQAIVDLGVDLRLNQRLGRDFTLASLKKDGYAAIFLALGAHKSRELNIEGTELDGVFRAVDYLLNINQGYEVNLYGKVMVIGGGSVAFDVARSVIRQAPQIDTMSPETLRKVLHQATDTLEHLTEGQAHGPEDMKVALDVARQLLRTGVKEVHMYCLESMQEIPATKVDIKEALEEGVQLHTGWGPKRILGKQGKVGGLELIKVQSVFDRSGRFNPTFVEGSEETVEADGIILAVGQAADLSWIEPGDNLSVTQRGTIETDPQTMATSRPDIFAGGDVAFGPRIVITAVAEGRRAARSIAAYLGEPLPTKTVRVRSTVYNAHRMFPGYERIPRRDPESISVDRRVGITEIEEVFTRQRAVDQARRCLICHMGPVFDGDTCVLCGGCVDVCPESCLRIVDAGSLNGSDTLHKLVMARYGRLPGKGGGSAIIKDEARCIRCGLCAARCPTGAVTMERIETLNPD
ncbi:MAG TPA: FAD-dependent oxidoreductase [Oceanipulchritudo sp.]|nr:FAD-dependent oxidoreductase [Oceanipulchritudo sp.]